MSAQEAVGERRGTVFQLNLLDGSVIRGRYDGRKAGKSGEIAIRAWDGALRQVPLEAIQSVEVPTPKASDQIGYYIIFGVVVGLGYFVIHSLTYDLP
jgi:hypothetical protein